MMYIVSQYPSIFGRDIELNIKKSQFAWEAVCTCNTVKV